MEQNKSPEITQVHMGHSVYDEGDISNAGKRMANK